MGGKKQDLKLHLRVIESISTIMPKVGCLHASLFESAVERKARTFMERARGKGPIQLPLR